MIDKKSYFSLLVWIHSSSTLLINRAALPSPVTGFAAHYEKAAWTPGCWSKKKTERRTGSTPSSRAPASRTIFATCCGSESFGFLLERLGMVRIVPTPALIGKREGKNIIPGYHTRKWKSHNKSKNRTANNPVSSDCSNGTFSLLNSINLLSATLLREILIFDWSNFDESWRCWSIARFLFCW